MADHARHWWTRRAATLHLLRLLEADLSVAGRRHDVIAGLAEVTDQFIPRVPQRAVTILPRYEPPTWGLPAYVTLPGHDQPR